MLILLPIVRAFVLSFLKLVGFLLAAIMLPCGYPFDYGHPYILWRRQRRFSERTCLTSEA